MLGEQNTSVNVNKASSVENQTSVPDKLERAADEDKLVEETPDTVRGQLAELFHAVRTRDDSSRNFLLRVVQPGLVGPSAHSLSEQGELIAYWTAAGLVRPGCGVPESVVSGTPPAGGILPRSGRPGN